MPAEINLFCQVIIYSCIPLRCLFEVLFVDTAGAVYSASLEIRMSVQLISPVRLH